MDETTTELSAGKYSTPMPAQAQSAARLIRAVEALLLLGAAFFFALHFVHLKADFPNHSPWMDWSKYTDEGWYGDAAIRHYQLGHWNVPGDFNPAAALPVWPVLEMALFHVTGVSLVAARALTVVVFGLILLCSYKLVLRSISMARGITVADNLERRSLAPALAVVLLAASPLCFAFTRLAILEPLLILLTLAAMLVASAACSNVELTQNRSTVWAVLLGLLLTLIVLTKTTGVFLFPAIFWMLWAASEYRLKPSLRAALIVCGVAAATWGGYYILFVRPHYLLDYRYLFSANAYTGVTIPTFWPVLLDTIAHGVWIGGTLLVLAEFAVVGALVALCFRRFCGNPLVVSLLLWIFGYTAFIAYHANLQPRYYLVIAIPLTLLVAIVFDALLAGALNATSRSAIVTWLLRLTTVASGVALVIAMLAGVRQTLGFLRHPEYGWVNAAEQIHQIIEREQGTTGHSSLLLSISGSDLSLMTGLHSICDDFGTMALPDRVAVYKPGWFATWNDVEDDKMEALSPLYRLVRVTAIPVFDDPERNLLILYRLDSVDAPGPPGRSERRRSLSIPRLRTKLGEQPSSAQLKH